MVTITTVTTVVTSLTAQITTLYNPTPAPVARLSLPLPNINFPDPAIIWAEGRWWAFATATRGNPLHQHFQLASSIDYRYWQIETYPNGNPYDPLPVLPSWVIVSDVPETWAPDVVKLDNGSFVMYWSAKLNGTTSTHCVSAATSANVRGPYIPLNQILVCPNNSLGAFDVNGFKDWELKGDWSLPIGVYEKYPRRTKCPRKLLDGGCGNSYIDNEWSEGGYGGQRYIVYKWQNAYNTPSTPLTLQAVEPDGVTLVGGPIVLLDNVYGDYGSIEAPSIYKTRNGIYVLTFSRGNTVLSQYTVSYAVAANISGPYVRKGDLLKTGDFNLNGPGGADISFNGERMVFHEMGQGVGWQYQGLRVMHAVDIDIVDETGEIKIVPI